MILKHQYYTTNASHRIVELDIAGFLKKAGEWSGYNNLATFTTSTGIIYIAVTDYFSGTLEADVIYQLSKTEFKSERKMR